jgi:hypothetical protein
MLVCFVETGHQFEPALISMAFEQVHAFHIHNVITRFRPNDGSSNLGGADEITDLEFFNTYSIPLIRQAVTSFMELETIEIPSQHLSYFVGSRQTDKKKDQIEFTEVRLCRLLHYFVDRPELGMPILNETLLMFLEYACKRDQELLKELQVVSFETNVIFEGICF